VCEWDARWELEENRSNFWKGMENCGKDDSSWVNLIFHAYNVTTLSHILHILELILTHLMQDFWRHILVYMFCSFFDSIPFSLIGLVCRLMYSHRRVYSRDFYSYTYTFHHRRQIHLWFSSFLSHSLTHSSFLKCGQSVNKSQTRHLF
jgi:hypothetical protein